MYYSNLNEVKTTEICPLSNFTLNQQQQKHQNKKLKKDGLTMSFFYETDKKFIYFPY